MIEIVFIDFICLVDKDVCDEFIGNELIEMLIDYVYWKKGGLIMEMGKFIFMFVDFEWCYK